MWCKKRSASENNVLADTSRGGGKFVYSDDVSAELSNVNLITAFNTNGFSIGPTAGANGNTATYASWTFRKANKFFDVQTVTVSGGVTATVDLSSLTTVGMVAVKRTDSTSAWFVYHRSCTSTKLVYLNTTAAETSDGSVTLSGTTLSLVGGTIANGTYVVYAWAHDTSATGMVQCGSYTGNGSTTGPVITLGWEPQYVLIKRKDTDGGWYVVDTMRGLSMGGAGVLFPNGSGAEEVNWVRMVPSATGFQLVTTDSGWNYNASSYIYLAIRRPNKPPTSGTQVYNAIARTGTGAAATVTGVGFAPDAYWASYTGATYGGHAFETRLTGKGRYLLPSGTDVEASESDSVVSFNMDGVSLGIDAGTGYWNINTRPYINWFFKRAPGVFDTVCYTGTGVAKTEAHNLGVAPELVICKARTYGNAWTALCTAGTDWINYLCFNYAGEAASGQPTIFGNGTSYIPPTTTTLYLGSQVGVNESGSAYVAYLFATKAGVSKVGSYTGNGSTQTLDMGFSGGARFFMVKRTDSTGDWFVFDNTRGIVAADDPHLSLNTTAAEVTNDDSVDPEASGIKVNELAATHINVTSATYIYLAFA